MYLVKLAGLPTRVFKNYDNAVNAIHEQYEVIRKRCPPQYIEDWIAAEECLIDCGYVDEDTMDMCDDKFYEVEYGD